MQATISLTNFNEKTMDQVIVEEIEDKNDFFYLDNQNCECHVIASKNSFSLIRKADDHALEIHADRQNPFILVSSVEGELKLDIKVVDLFIFNDILEIRYILDSEERLLTISYK